jgi:hypothetical protein
MKAIVLPAQFCLLSLAQQFAYNQSATPEQGDSRRDCLKTFNPQETTFRIQGAITLLLPKSLAFQFEIKHLYGNPNEQKHSTSKSAYR